MEIAIAFAGLVLTFLGLLIAWFSRNDKLLRDIRDVLIDIREKLPMPPSDPLP